MKMPKSHSFGRLVDWVEGTLGEEEAAVVAADVAQADDKTQAAVVWLRTFFRASESIVLASPPAKVRDILTRRFEAYAQDRRQPGFLQRLIATLTFDGNRQLVLVGAREVGIQASPRQLVYSTDVADIALSIQPQSADDSLRPAQGRLLDVAGQVFPNDDTTPGPFAVQLLQDSTELGLTTTDDLGEFAFTGVPAGTYDIILSNDEAEILISGVEFTV